MFVYTSANLPFHNAVKYLYAEPATVHVVPAVSVVPADTVIGVATIPALTCNASNRVESIALMLGNNELATKLSDVPIVGVVPDTVTAIVLALDASFIPNT